MRANDVPAGQPLQPMCTALGWNPTTPAGEAFTQSEQQ